MKRRRLFKFLLIAMLFFVLLLPSIEKLDHTYQESLWTWNTWRKRGKPIDDVQFRIGGKVNGIMTWTRIKLGFPIAPITVDIQFAHKIIQVRVELYYLILMLVIAGFFTLIVIFLFYWLYIPIGFYQSLENFFRKLFPFSGKILH